MKKLLNTLYVSTQGIYLRQEGETLVAEFQREVKLRLPIHTLSGIVCFGNVMCSPFLLGLCGERGIHVSFLNEYGKFLARVSGPISGNVLLRREQFRVVENPPAACLIAKNIVLGKIANSRTVLQRLLRDHGEDERVAHAVNMLANILRRVQSVEDVDTLRGLEGEAAMHYFSVFDSLIVSQKKDFAMTVRSRRPPLDPINTLISFLYTILAHDCEGALEGVGLDPQMGFLHALRPGRPSLALDLMEEFRPLVADSAVLSAINTGMVTPGDFVSSPAGCAMKDGARKALIRAYELRLDQMITHPIFNYRCSWRAVIRVQAKLLAKALRGEIPAYTGITTR